MRKWCDYTTSTELEVGTGYARVVYMYVRKWCDYTTSTELEVGTGYARVVYIYVRVQVV